MFYKSNKKIHFISTLAVVAFLSANVNAENRLMSSNIKIGVEEEAPNKEVIAIEKTAKESPKRLEESDAIPNLVESENVPTNNELLDLPISENDTQTDEFLDLPEDTKGDDSSLDLSIDLDTENAPSLDVKKIDKEIEKKKAENKNLDDAVKNILADINNDKKAKTDEAPVGLLGLNENIVDNLKGSVFSKMSNLEKQNALLDLELKQEKIKNEIEALKQKRKDAEIQREEKLKQIEADRFKSQQEQERLTLVEKQKLAEKEKELKEQEEEKKLNAYKLELISERNKWINKYDELYKSLRAEKDSKVKIVNDIQKLLIDVTKSSAKANSEAKKSKAIYEAKLKQAKKTEMLLRAELKKKNDDNPFATPAILSTTEKDATPAAESYAIMEIRGQGDELVAQLLNKSGKSFYVKSGTLLKSGHVVTEIGKNYVKLGYGKTFETLYFAAGGILEREPEDVKAKSNIAGKEPAKTSRTAQSKPTRNYTVTKGVPGMNKGMLVK